MATAIAAIVGGVIAGGGAIGGSILGGNASKDAAEKAQGVQMYALALQKKMYEDQQKRFQPFYDQGISSLEDYVKMLKGGYDMKESPAAQYELQQGTKMMNRQLAARGMLGGGTAANRLAELSGGIAARDWHNQYSRLLDSLKLGTGAASSMGQSGQVFGGQVGQGANALSQIYMNEGANRAGLYQNIGNTISNMGGLLGYAGLSGGFGQPSGSGGGIRAIKLSDGTTAYVNR